MSKTYLEENFNKIAYKFLVFSEFHEVNSQYMYTELIYESYRNHYARFTLSLFVGPD